MKLPLRVGSWSDASLGLLGGNSGSVGHGVVERYPALAFREHLSIRAIVRRTGLAGRLAPPSAELQPGVLVPLDFGPGEAFQFDCSEKHAVIGGERTNLQIAHLKLCHSRA